MKDRCYRISHKKYHRYGLRGIKICDEWRNDFAAFRAWANVNGYNDTLTIDRIDNDGDYSPTNCKWSDFVQQNRNRSTTMLTKDKAISIALFLKTGKKLREAAEKYGISISHAWQIKNGTRWK
jgi:hypothetical protein